MSELSGLQAVQIAVDYIEHHLDEALTPGVVASMVGFSEFHFHRMFVSLVGESITAYKRRRRLSRAAQRLNKSNATLSVIATEAGFESQESFTRAFKALFGSTPGQYRKYGGLFAMEKPKLTPEAITHLQAGLTMEPKFVSFPGQSVVGMGAGFTPETTDGIPLLWEKFVKRCHENRLDALHAFGICISDHPQIPKKPGDVFVYLAAVKAPQGEYLSQGLVRFDIAPGRYAVFTHKGSIKDFPLTIKYIWSTWIPEHRNLYREAPDFELYDERFDPVTESGEVDVYIPVNG